MNSREINRYLEGIRKGIFCDRGTKKIFLSDLKGSIGDFLKDNPNATLSDIETHFGLPDDVASAFMSGIDPAESEMARREQGTGFVIIISLLITLVIFLGWALTYFYSYMGQIGIT